MDDGSTERDRSPRIVDAASLLRQPWRNGAGSTRVVVERTDPAGGPGWRLSLADLDRPATFSSYPGVDRCSVVVRGAGLELYVDGVPVPAGPLEVVRYAGEADVRSSLVEGLAKGLVGGPVVNLNLMVTRSTGQGSTEGRMQVHRVRGSRTWRPPTVAVVLIEGDLELPDGRPVPLLGTVLLDGRAVTLTARDAVVVAVAVSPAGA